MLKFHTLPLLLFYFINNTGSFAIKIKAAAKSNFRSSLIIVIEY